jgi:sugar/nucleoside kinase (ribokinase family)
VTSDRERPPAPAPDLVIAGNLLVDDIVYADGRTLMAEPGGAVLYGALAASLWPVRVGIVAPRGDDYPAWALDALAARGVDLAGLRPLGGPGLRTWLLYEPLGRRVVHRLGAATHAAASPRLEDFPAGWDRARVVHVPPIPFGHQRALVAGLAACATGVCVSIDPHETVREDNLAAWREVLADVWALFVSGDELQLAGAAHDPAASSRRLGPSRVSRALRVCRMGERGGFVRDENNQDECRWEPRTDRVVEVTGAGDAFAAGFLCGLLMGDPLPVACRRGVVSASFALADRGPHGLVAATPERAAERLAAWTSATEESTA